MADGCGATGRDAVGNPVLQPERVVVMKLATESERTRWIAFVQAQPLPLDVEAKPWRKSRSNEQNALL